MGAFLLFVAAIVGLAGFALGLARAGATPVPPPDLPDLPEVPEETRAPEPPEAGTLTDDEIARLVADGARHLAIERAWKPWLQPGHHDAEDWGDVR